MAKEGRARLRLEIIAHKLGVTTGSFYWHFKNRDEFVISVAQYWADWSTTQAINAVMQKEGSASERLMILMEHVTENDLSRYDIVMRSWALHEPQVARVIKKVDKARLQFVRQLLSEVGFTGYELEIRAHLFAAFHSMEKGFLAGVDKMGRKKILKLRHAFFTRP
ncbi:MAG: TetR/AcrR family transcriptional regulator [Deltaproteobacteria bacterium]|nr:TetR/AcrR family transcriptional regulator [Deltaproteobacteria bacterium]